MLTSTGWMSGKTYKGNQITNYCNYSQVLDSDKNFIANDDELIYGIHIFESK